MTTDFQYDVFLKPNQAGKPQVRQLAESLRAANLRDLTIKRGLEAARTLVLCLFPGALRSDCVGLERSTVGRGNLPFRHPANAVRRFIPLLLAGCE